MPFEKIYEVNFSGFNLEPHINTLYWPDMQLYPQTNTPMASSYADPAGIILQITRNPGAVGMAMKNVFVVPSGGIPMHTRLLVQVEFDLPRASGFPLGVVGPISRENTLSSGGQGSRGSQGDRGRRPMHAETNWGLGNDFSVPEPWALALNISPRADLNTPQADAKVTCQFHRGFNGVRLNTPGALQTDQPTPLEEPLDYARYQGPAAPLIPRFLLEHSFCGWTPRSGTNHASGCGFLTIARKLGPPAIDHRVYSYLPLEESLGTPSTQIRAMGISLATLEGIGTVSVRLRSFLVWRNLSLP